MIGNVPDFAGLLSHVLTEGQQGLLEGGIWVKPLWRMTSLETHTAENNQVNVFKAPTAAQPRSQQVPIDPSSIQGGESVPGCDLRGSCQVLPSTLGLFSNPSPTPPRAAICLPGQPTHFPLGKGKQKHCPGRDKP